MVTEEQELEWRRLFDTRQSWLPLVDDTRSDVREAVITLHRIELLTPPDDDYVPAHIKKIYQYAPSDQNNLEMNFGAPALPLTELTRFFNIENSRRYPTVTRGGRNSAFRTYNTYVPEAKKIMQSLRRQGYGFWDFGLSSKEIEYQRYLHFSARGATGCFNQIIDERISYTRLLKEGLGNWYPFSGAAFIVPVPTYGLFLDVLNTKAEAAGVTVLKVPRDENGAVCLQNLEKAYEEARLLNLHVLAYYDNTPNNPSGYIRTRKETDAVCEMVLEHSKIDAHKIMERLPLADAYFNGSKSYDPTLFLAETIIIDDMAYAGLEHDPKSKVFGFGQIAGAEVITLFSLSKSGAPGLRAGMAVANGLGAEAVIGRMNLEQIYSEFCAGSFAVDALCAAFEKVGGRDGFLKSHHRALRSVHKYRASMLETFVNGIDHVNSLNKKEKNDLIDKYAAHSNIDRQEACKRLSEGLPLFTLDARPSGGFFYVMDCSALKGKHLAYYDTEYELTRCKPISTSRDVSMLFYCNGVDVVSGNRMGMPENSLKVRLSVSVEETDLFEFFNIARKMHQDILTNDPEIQFDLFRPRQAALGFRYPTPAV